MGKPRRMEWRKSKQRERKKMCKTEDEPFTISFLAISTCSQLICGDSEFTIKHTALSRIEMKSWPILWRKVRIQINEDRHVLFVHVTVINKEYRDQKERKFERDEERRQQAEKRRKEQKKLRNCKGKTCFLPGAHNCTPKSGLIYVSQRNTALSDFSWSSPEQQRNCRFQSAFSAFLNLTGPWLHAQSFMPSKQAKIADMTFKKRLFLM